MGVAGLCLRMAPWHISTASGLGTTLRTVWGPHGRITKHPWHTVPGHLLQQRVTVRKTAPEAPWGGVATDTTAPRSQGHCRAPEGSRRPEAGRCHKQTQRRRTVPWTGGLGAMLPPGSALWLSLTSWCRREVAPPGGRMHWHRVWVQVRPGQLQGSGPAPRVPGSQSLTQNFTQGIWPSTSWDREVA